MISRREILIGAACVATAGTGVALKPRHRVSLLGTDKLAGIVPQAFGNWTSTDVSDEVAPPSEDSLQAKLYGETVGRVYQDAAAGVEIMMLLAHGDSQTNELQLHRPEVCYPAFGYELSGVEKASIPIRGCGGLPGRQLVATAPGKQEHIVYWTRLGEYLPTDGTEQRLDRLETALRGIIADGLLARFSIIGAEDSSAFAKIDAFIGQLVLAVPKAKRAALIGTTRARALAIAGI